MLSPYRAGWVWLFILLGLGGLLYSQVRDGWPLETDMLALLPSDRKDPLAEAAFHRFAQHMAPRVIYVLSDPERARLKKAVDAFGDALRTTPLFQEVRTRVDEEDQAAWAALYFPRRSQFLGDAQRERLLHPEAQVDHVLRTIYNPFSGVSATELERDPFLLFREYLLQLNRPHPSFTVDDGYLIAQFEDLHVALILAELAVSPYSMTAHRHLQQLEEAEQALRQQFGVDFRRTGIVYYAAHGSASAQREISTIGLGALTGIILLFLLTYRSIRPLYLAFLSVACGLLCAFTITIAVFGEIHLFSLIMGASLIGVSIDYAFHYLTNRLATAERWDAQTGLKEVMPPMTLSLVSSLIGYLALLVAPFPGLQQLSLFSAAGIAGAYGTVVCWYPLLTRAPAPTSSDRPFPFTTMLDRWLALWQRPWARFGLPTFALAAALLLLTQRVYNDDVRQLQALPTALVEQDRDIAEWTGFQPSQQLILVTGPDQESVLRSVETQTRSLRLLMDENRLGGYTAITDWVPSEEQQQSDRALVERLYEEGGPLLQEKLGLQQAPVLREPFDPLRVEDFLATETATPWRFLWTEHEDGTYSGLILLRRVEDAQAIRALLQDHPDTRYIDKTEDLSVLFGAYRMLIIYLMSIACLLIAPLMGFRYGWRKGLRTLLPPATASMCGLAFVVATGTSLNLFNFLAMILVLAIGLDYSFFFAERSRPRSVLLAITLSATTTMLAFGLLSLSATQAIHSFGLTVLSGVMIAWLLAPLAMDTNKG